VRAFFWILAGSCVAALVGALIIAWLFTADGNTGIFASTGFGEFVLVGLLFTLPTAAAGAGVLLLVRAVSGRLNVLLTAASGALVGLLASFVIDPSGGLVAWATGIGCAGCVAAHPLFARSNP
jgi:hypothetical protein